MYLWMCGSVAVYQCYLKLLILYDLRICGKDALLTLVSLSLFVCSTSIDELAILQGISLIN